MLIVGKDREAGNSVQILEKTFYGRVLITAKQGGSGSWKITLEYPVIGVDPISVELADRITEDLRTVRLLERWVRSNDDLFANAVRQARKLRYDYRSHLFKEDGNNG